MADLFTRTYTFVDGTTAYGSQVEAEIDNIVTVLNNLNTAVTTWGQVSISHATSVPLIADCAAGTQNIAQFKNNNVTKASISSAGLLTAVGATMSAAIAMGSNKITGLAAATANGDAVRFEQISGFRILQVVQGTSSTAFNTTSSTFQTTNTSVSITPSATTSKVFVIAGGSCSSATPASSSAIISIFRDTTNLGNATNGMGIGDNRCQATISWLDSPSTTSAITSSVKLKNQDGVTTVNFGLGNDATRITAFEIG